MIDEKLLYSTLLLDARGSEMSLLDYSLPQDLALQIGVSSSSVVGASRVKRNFSSQQLSPDHVGALSRGGGSSSGDLPDGCREC